MPAATMENPLSTYVISPVMPLARSDSRNAATLPTSSVVTLRRSGAFFSHEALDLREAADAGGRERLDRSGRDAVDADALGTEAGREIADVRLEARLGEAHHVVVRQRPHRAEVGERHAARRGAPASAAARPWRAPRGCTSSRRARWRTPRATCLRGNRRRAPRAARTRWRAAGRRARPTRCRAPRTAPSTSSSFVTSHGGAAPSRTRRRSSRRAP